jgi:hypothetical protein
MTAKRPRPHTPRLIVEVRWGPLQGKKACCPPGQRIAVGRAPTSDLAVECDEEMADLQFELQWDGRACTLAHRGGDTETLLGGEACFAGDVTHGQWLRAGSTDFSVYFEDKIPPPEVRDPAALARAELALATLDRDPGPLFALVDAARDDRVLELLRQSVEMYRSLYDGVEGETMAEAAPYIVGIPAGSRLRTQLLNEGWGRRWITVLRSPKPLLEVRRHLRKFLMAELEGTEDPVYFRFHDPEVLRVYMQSCDTTERKPWFDGVVDAFFVEDPDADLSCLRIDPVVPGPRA